MKNKKYGTYYGKLVDVTKKDNEIVFHDYDLYHTKEMIDYLISIGVKEILFDVEDNNNYSSTMFFEIKDSGISYTDMNSLFVYIVNMRPNEFSEESTNCFRLWFD